MSSGSFLVKSASSICLEIKRAACGNEGRLSCGIEAYQKTEEDGRDADGNKISSLHVDGIGLDDEGAF